MSPNNKRICIIGSVASGKSTLAITLSSIANITDIIHLDQLAHYENTNWVRRPNSDIIEEQDKYLDKEQWIIEGNYSACMPQRFSKASHIIWLDFGRFNSLFRYLKRCIFANKHRYGKLNGSKKEFSFRMIYHILFIAPQNKSWYQKMIDKFNVPITIINSQKDLDRFIISLKVY